MAGRVTDRDVGAVPLGGIQAYNVWMSGSAVALRVSFVGGTYAD